MQEATTSGDPVLAFRRDLNSLLQSWIREALHVVLEEELEEALGCSCYDRSDARRGYHYGRIRRCVTTALLAAQQSR